MSHYLGYVLLPEPPRDAGHLDGMLMRVMAPFDEASDYADARNPDGLWDYWRVGGRWGWQFDAIDLEAGYKFPLDDWDSPTDRRPGLDVTCKANIKEAPTAPFTLFAEGFPRTKINWNTYPEGEIPDDEWNAWWERFYAGLPADAWLAVVDYHS